MTRKEFVESVRKDVFLLTSEGYIGEAEGAEMLEKALKQKMDGPVNIVDDADDDAAADDAPEKAEKGVFKSVIFPKSTAYDVNAIAPSGPRVVPDDGTDVLGREYSDEVMARIAGAMSRLLGGAPDAIPAAGAGQTWEGDTRRISNAPDPGFKPGTDGGYIGGEEVPFKPARPNLGADGAYSLKEIGELDGIVTRMGNGYVLSPQDPGIAPTSSARFPDALTSVLKSKGMRGLFSNIIRRPTSHENGKG